MFLKSLEIQGFKSFPDKTVLSFGAGMTAVVGPNGSGKSNISDAIRWVLGEQSVKNLRGSKMEEVIFSGTTQRKGVGFAEVSLIIDNTLRKLDFDADDVKVTRRYYRSGNSDYLLNNVVVRLKDVQLLFMDTGLGRDGYSIIGQGRIEDIVSSKSEERREIFEEAAGISEYRYRKNEAERRLKATEENLLRLRDILKELEERVGPLEAQAEKAKKYLQYAGEKKELEIGVWLHTLAGAKDTLREWNAKLALARGQHEAAGEKMEELENEMETITQASHRLLARMDEVRTGVGRLEEQATRCDGEAAVFQNDIFHNGENLRRIEDSLAADRQGDVHMEEEIARQQADIQTRNAEIAAAEAEGIRLAEEMAGLSRSSDEVSGHMEALSHAAAEMAMQLSDLRVAAVTDESAVSEMTMRLAQLTAALAQRQVQDETVRESLAECELAHGACCERVEELRNAVSGYELRFAARAQKREAARQDAEKQHLDAEEKRRRGRLLEDLERNMEGFAHSVKTVMKQAERGALSGILGPVSRLIHAQAAYALAVETALGGAAQNVVCQREEDAKRGIAYLKEINGGRATFLPLTSVKGNLLNEQGLDSQPGFVGLASSLVTYDAAYTDVARSLLGRVAVAEDLDYAVAIARKFGYRFRIVTLDGQLVNAGGSLTGGSHAKGTGLLSRRTEIETIQKEAAVLAEKATQARELFLAIQQETAAVEAALTGAKGELATANEDRIRFEGELRRLTELHAANKEAIVAHAAEIETLQTRAQECTRRVAQAQAQMQELGQKKDAIEGELAGVSGGRQELTRQREELMAAMADKKLLIVGYHKEIEAAENTIHDWELRREDAAGHCAALQAQMRELEQKNEDITGMIADAGAQAAAFRAQAVNAAAEIETLAAKRAEGEAAQTRMRALARDKSEEREQAGREVVRLEEKCASVSQQADEVVRRLYEEYELTRLEAEVIAKPIEDVAAANRRLNELKGKMRNLGSVNVEAIEEYKEVSERYEFLRVQVNDVEVSRSELLGLITEITMHMREIFLERFKQINYQYGLVFTELFGGGKGELRLSDPDDILNSGIELHIQPPGKVILNLSALSGGEKALSAIALLFAILRVTPSPFCVLDEIEAALDDVNVDRYAAYLRRMCEHTQFILITHRRGTMEEADVLYGVTMQERGVSKLLELRASEVMEKLGI